MSVMITSRIHPFILIKHTDLCPYTPELVSYIHRSHQNISLFLQMATTVYSSAQPLLALLNESDVELQGYALETLDSQVQTYWSELTGALSTMYVLLSHTIEFCVH